jgi:hypothetical protein
MERADALTQDHPGRDHAHLSITEVRRVRTTSRPRRSPTAGDTSGRPSTGPAAGVRVAGGGRPVQGVLS